MSGADVTAEEVIAVSRLRPSGVEAVLRLRDWELTRRMLQQRRMGIEAWVTRDGKAVELTLGAAAMIAESLNQVRPWEGGR